jgi:proteic killer suppression protein
MILSFRHKGLERFFTSGKKAGIQAHHAVRLRLILTMLNQARNAMDMDAPGLRLHRLTGSLKDQWSVSVDRNWRVIFRFIGNDAELVDYVDYH